LKNEVTVSAPGKLMLFGEHAVVYGKPCIVTAVDQRITINIEESATDFIEINAPEVDIKGFKIALSALEGANEPKEVKFIIASVKNFFNKYNVASGLTITTKSEFSSLFGFGSSSAVTAGTVKALAQIFDLHITNKDMFDIAYRSVLDIQGVGSGFDVASAIWGGTLYFTGGGKVIKPLGTTGLPLIVGYTGIKADTVTLIRQVAELQKFQKAKIEDIFDSIQKVVEEAGGAIEDSNYRKLGELMTLNQNLLTKLGVSTRELDNLIEAALGAGAYGAKLSGAGGGDCMIAMAGIGKRKDVGEAIERAGGRIIDINPNAEGVKIGK
jgi:mevalonate kinase